MMHAAARSAAAMAAAVTILSSISAPRGCVAATRPLCGSYGGGSADEPVVGGSATESAVVGVVVLWVVGVSHNAEVCLKCIYCSV